MSKGKIWRTENHRNKKKKLSVTLILGGTVTIMSPDGTPVQVNASALQAASAQNAVGTLNSIA